MHDLYIRIVLLLAVCTRVLGQACPPAAVRVQTKINLADVKDNAEDGIKKLASCLGLQGCSLETYEFGQCGAAKSTRVSGATKSATISINPDGCTDVYNCNGVYVDKEVYDAVSDFPDLAADLTVADSWIAWLMMTCTNLLGT